MIHQITAFCHAHAEVMALLGLAFVATMPEKLPYSLRPRVVMDWAWEWLHGGLNTFISLRGPRK